MRLFPPPLRKTLLLAACLAGLLVPSAAHASGTPNITMSVDSPSTVLFGAQSTVTLQASNPAGQPYGYNLAFREVLPAGVTYVLGSSSSGTEPQVLPNAPAAGQTTLIWGNTSDLSPGSS